MDILRIVFGNLWKHPVRTVLTGISMVLALFLLATLRSLVTSLDALAATSASNRLWVQSAVSLFVDMPLSYPSKIEAVAGVEEACKFQWFGGVYQDPKNFFGQFAVDGRKMLDMYPEFEIVEGSREQFLDARQGALVGIRLMDRFGWKVGDRIPLKGALFPHPDGLEVPWEFDITAVYSTNAPNLDESTFYFHFELFQETLREGTGEDPGVGAIVLRTEPGANATAVMREVDGLFENGPQRVHTSTESEFQAMFASMYGNVSFFMNTIGSGVLFAILLACLNTMLMAGREQVHDVGILKSLGFSNRMVFVVLLGQALLLTAVGGALGLVLVKSLEGPIRGATQTVLPNFTVENATLVLGAFLTLAVGLVAGFLPAWRAARMRPVTALSDRI